jgi:hypothetical protein
MASRKGLAAPCFARGVAAVFPGVAWQSVPARCASPPGKRPNSEAAWLEPERVKRAQQHSLVFFLTQARTLHYMAGRAPISSVETMSVWRPPGSACLQANNRERDRGRPRGGPGTRTEARQVLTRGAHALLLPARGGVCSSRHVSMLPRERSLFTVIHRHRGFPTVTHLLHTVCRPRLCQQLGLPCPLRATDRADRAVRADRADRVWTTSEQFEIARGCEAGCVRLLPARSYTGTAQLLLAYRLPGFHPPWRISAPWP